MNLSTFFNMKINEQSNFHKKKLEELFLADFSIFFSFVTHLKNEYNLETLMLSNKKDNQQHSFYQIVFNNPNNITLHYINLYELVERNNYYHFNDDLFSTHLKIMFHFERELRSLINNKSILETPDTFVIDEKLLWLNNFLIAIDKIQFKENIHQLFLDYYLPSKEIESTLKTKI